MAQGDMCTVVSGLGIVILEGNFQGVNGLGDIDRGDSGHGDSGLERVKIDFTVIKMVYLI